MALSSAIDALKNAILDNVNGLLKIQGVNFEISLDDSGELFVASASTADAPVELPPEQKLGVEEPVTMEIPMGTIGGDLPPPELPVPALELPLAMADIPQEPAPVEASASEPHVILSLNSSVEIPAVYDSTGNGDKLCVMSDVTDDGGALCFWYGGMMFIMPIATLQDAHDVVNPDHPLTPNTIRIVMRKTATPDTTTSMLVDVVKGDAEQLILPSQMSTMESAPTFKVSDKVTVPASTGDAYGEQGVIEEIKNGQARVKFSTYEKWIDLDKLRSPKMESKEAKTGMEFIGDDLRIDFDNKDTSTPYVLCKRAGANWETVKSFSTADEAKTAGVFLNYILKHKPDLYKG